MIKIRNLNIGYNTKLLASDFSANIYQPGLIAIIGDNGIGKSTLINTIAGLIPPKKGQVFIDNKDLKFLSFTERAKKIGIVLPHFPENMPLSVKELLSNTAMVAHKSMDNNTINKAIELTQINSLVNKQFNSLSDGQKQKVMIARALAQDTPILLMDEPFVHLDHENKKIIINALEKLKEQKIIILTSHDYLSITMANTIWFFEKGKIASLTPDEFIIKSPVLNEIYNFYASLNVNQRKIKSI